jgi:hypothetical protein
MAEKISSDVVLATAGTTSVKPTFVQRAGLWLAAGVGAIIAVVTVFILVFVYRHYPMMPASESLRAAGTDAKNVIEQYTQLSQVAIKGGTDLFQTIVTQALLPVLTAILGYIFGKGERSN